MKKQNKNQWIAIVVAILALGFLFFVGSGFFSPFRLNIASENNPAEVIKSAVVGKEAKLNNVIDSSETFETITELISEDLENGTGAEAEVGSTVVVNYVGFLTDKTRFDDSWQRGEPFKFTIGSGQVIPGWEEGVVGMREGGIRALVIPPAMAYGANAVGPIPPNSVLIFIIELVEVI